jgi:ABC-type transport system involved in multi-copper enzyme maturation permease subunit
MWTLVRREIEDQGILFVLVLVVGIIHAGWAGGAFPSGAAIPPTRVPDQAYMMFFYLLLSLSAGAGILAALQIAADRNRGVSRFLCTLTVTRSQVLLAKWLAGLVWLLLGLLPVAVVCGVLAHRWAQMIPVDVPAVVAMVTGTGLLGLASYGFGMQTAMTARPAWVVLGSLAFAAGLVSLVVIKGFGLHTHVLAASVGLACLVRTWMRFHAIAF